MTARTLLSGLFAIGLGLVGLGASPAAAAEGERHVHDFSFSFEGPFGRYDQSQLQRGLQVYSEICSACHGLKFVAFRTLEDEGGPALSEEAMRAFAGQHEVFDVALDDTRVATPTDFFPPSNIPNAPDLSLMAKARAGFHGPAGLGINQILFGMGGPEYIASLLTGFTGEEREEAGTILYENTAFGGYMAMAPVLYGDDVTYADGTVATPEQIAEDVAAFLMWTAEPKMMERKRSGLTAVLFLTVLTVLLYFTNKTLWAPHKGKKHG
ncbi:MAG TPA: cytochrome c1 [Amaricoccus sp.]|uniref:cytochrome c1 n=1 Tax=Amaricoccus sp. TaxID=1872485 RepID=UPI002B58EAF6|nr:cytochrome c1 [Amaricoccus sp.]HMQ94309.1 cytochrome c1 [Amaricoccus sp.]HMR53973.1 cytochrome c1 [Amaricoccus sp.]HMR60951.1 cytochrome c1 [Amaricoccus sp.]HMU00969.1 cytochrome c1 [Amaricoccus sp.]